MTWPDGLRSGRLCLTGCARDLRTDAGGQPVVVDAVALRAEVDRNRGSRLLALDVHPNVPGIDDLLDEPVASGFRAAAERRLPEHERARTPLTC